jgi:hypothetical protein
MYVSMRVTPDEKELITKYAAAQGTTVSKVMRDAFFDRLEEEMDIRDYKEYLKRKAAGEEKTYTLDEVIKDCGLAGEL